MQRTLNLVWFFARDFFIRAAVVAKVSLSIPTRSWSHSTASSRCRIAQCLPFLLLFLGGCLGAGERTGSILAEADLDEGLDVGDFLRHGGRVWGVSGGRMSVRVATVAVVGRVREFVVRYVFGTTSAGKSWQLEFTTALLVFTSCAFRSHLRMHNGDSHGSRLYSCVH